MIVHAHTHSCMCTHLIVGWGQLLISPSTTCAQPPRLGLVIRLGRGRMHLLTQQAPAAWRLAPTLGRLGPRPQSRRAARRPSRRAPAAAPRARRRAARGVRSLFAAAPGPRLLCSRSGRASAPGAHRGAAVAEPRVVVAHLDHADVVRQRRARVLPLRRGVGGGGRGRGGAAGALAEALRAPGGAARGRLSARAHARACIWPVQRRARATPADPAPGSGCGAAAR